MPKPKQKDNYEALRRLWYRKLADSGFEDTEDLDGNLKTWIGHSRLPIEDTMQPITSETSYTSKVWKESQAEYYRLASQYLHDKYFPSEVHKLIWKLHAKGFTFRQIAQRTGMTKNKIQYRIEGMRERFFGKL